MFWVGHDQVGFELLSLLLSSRAPPPPAKWAQRKDRVLLTFELSDVTNPKIDITDSSLIFK